MRTSSEPVAAYWVLIVTLLIPFGMPKLLIWMMSTKPTLFYSNINGLKTIATFNGRKLTG